MSYGIRVINPTGELVIDSAAQHYRYHSSPSPVSGGSISGGVHTPHRFTVTLPTAGMIPMVFVRPEVGKAFAVYSIVPGSGSTVDIYVLGVNIRVGSPSDSQRNATQATPTIYVFCPMSASSETYGMRLFTPTGAVSFDTGFRPLSLRRVVNYGTTTAFLDTSLSTPYTGQAGYGPFVNGDQQTFTALTTPAVFGNTNGYGECEFTSAAERADWWHHGWTLTSGGALQRFRIWGGTDKPLSDLDAELAAGTLDLTIDMTLNPATALLIDAAGL